MAEAEQSPQQKSHKTSSHDTHAHHVEEVGNAIDSSWIAAPFGLFILLGMLAYSVKGYYEKSQDTGVDEEAIPRLAHVVWEIQGWRRSNYLAAGVMLVTFSMLVLGMMWYRRVRAERAGRHENIYWGLSAASVVCLVFFILYRRRMRNIRSVRDQMKFVAKNPSKARLYVTWGLIVTLLIGLIWYRRRIHARRLAKKQEKLMRIRSNADHQTVVSKATTPGRHQRHRRL